MDDVIADGPGLVFVVFPAFGDIDSKRELLDVARRFLGWPGGVTDESFGSLGAPLAPESPLGRPPQIPRTCGTVAGRSPRGRPELSYGGSGPPLKLLAEAKSDENERRLRVGDLTRPGPVARRIY